MTPPEADWSGVPADAWQRGAADAKAGHIPPVGADDHILAASSGPPWLEPRWPARQTGTDSHGNPLYAARTVTLHGGAYDGCLLELRSLGQHLTVLGEHGPAEYEYKESDDSSASYTAVDDEIERWPVDRSEAPSAERSEGRGLTGSSRARADRSETSQPPSTAPIGVPAAAPPQPPDEPRSLF